MPVEECELHEMHKNKTGEGRAELMERVRDTNDSRKLHALWDAKDRLNEAVVQARCCAGYDCTNHNDKPLSWLYKRQLPWVYHTDDETHELGVPPDLASLNGLTVARIEEGMDKDPHTVYATIENGQVCVQAPVLGPKCPEEVTRQGPITPWPDPVCQDQDC
jgi:hypothetical protein